MEIKILGIGCKNCVNLAKNTEEALKELGMEATITKVTDMKDIAKYGIMRTPDWSSTKKLFPTVKSPVRKKLQNC